MIQDKHKEFNSYMREAMAKPEPTKGDDKAYEEEMLNFFDKAYVLFFVTCCFCLACYFIGIDLGYIPISNTVVGSTAYYAGVLICMVSIIMSIVVFFATMQTVYTKALQRLEEDKEKDKSD